MALTPQIQTITKERDPIIITSMIGELDMDNVGDTRDRLLVLVPKSAKALIVDLSELQYLDSAGVSLLVDINNQLGRSGQAFELIVADTAPIRRILSLVKLELIIPIHTDHETALSAWREDSSRNSNEREQ